MIKQIYFKSRKMRGFTFLETMVAAAILMVIISISIGIFTLSLAQKSANTQMLTIQNNFGNVCSKAEDELKMAYSLDNVTIQDGLVDINGSKISRTEPVNGGMSNKLVFGLKRNNEIDIVEYCAKVKNGATRIYRVLYRKPSDSPNYEKISEDPLTPYLTQITNMYFTNNNGKIVLVLNSKMNINGKESNVSYIDLVYIRNFTK
jgi:competence protein ComGF